MPDHDDELYRQRLEKQLQADIEVLQEAHRIKLRAYETVRRAQAEEGAAPAPAADPSPSERSRSSANELYSAVSNLLAALPEVFDKSDVCSLLGYEPRRTTLHRVFKYLLVERRLQIEDPRGGQWPTLYRRVVPSASKPT